MPEATLIGYHGRRNLGDDIFLRVGCEWLQARCRPSTIFVAGYSDAIPDALPGCRARIVPFERRNAWFARSVWLRTFQYAMRSRLVLFAAGSIFTIQPFFLAYLLLKIVRTVRPGIRIVALGVSIGPLRSAKDEAWCARLLSLFDVIALRDAESAEIVRHLKIAAPAVLGYDLALRWSPALRSPLRDRDNAVLGVCLNERACTARSGDPNSSVGQALVAALQAMATDCPALKIRLLVVCTDPIDGDSTVTSQLHDSLAAAGVTCERATYSGDDPESFLQAISSCGGVVTSRMHTGVLAMMQGVPVLQISYAPKIPAFYSHCGIEPDCLLDTSELTHADVLSFARRIQAGEEEPRARQRRGQLLACADRLMSCMEAAERRLHA
jgi:polysaccharide pyruvyl transferase WcaK-like protein